LTKTIVVTSDFDVGLRNLDLIMGCERRVVYDLVNLVNQESSLHQTLIKDKRIENLYILPASQTRDKDALTIEGIARVIHKLKKSDFDYIICDSPAGIEKGAKMALYFAEGQMLSVDDIVDLLAIPLLGIIPESQTVLESSNSGKPVILDDESEAGQAYSDAIDRLMGENKPHRFMEATKKGFFKRLFG